MKRIATLVFGLALAVGGIPSKGQTKVETIPFMSTEVKLLPQAATAHVIPYVEAGDGRVILVKGPFGPAQTEAYAARMIRIIEGSATIQGRLDYLRQGGPDWAVVLVGHRGGPPGEMPDENSAVELFVVRVHPKRKNTIPGDLLADPSKREFVSAIVASVNPAVGEGKDPVTCVRIHPRKGIPCRWRNMMASVEGRMRRLGGDPRKGPGKLVLVQSPLPTARDNGFAVRIMDRLAGSQTVKRMLSHYQIGGDVMAVAFPRPAANWSMEGTDSSKIAAFIMLVRKKRPVSDTELFRQDMKDARNLEAGFMVEMDFSLSPSKDAVNGDPFVVGRFCDLEERWDYFLSCVE